MVKYIKYIAIVLVLIIVIAPAYNQLAYLIGSALNKLIICSGRFCTLRI